MFFKDYCVGAEKKTVKILVIWKGKSKNKEIYSPSGNLLHKGIKQTLRKSLRLRESSYGRNKLELELSSEL